MPLYWMAPANFEENVPLSKSTTVGKVTIGCTVDNYSHTVAWGDGTTSPLSTPGVAHPYTLPNGTTITVVDPGTYGLFANADKTYGSAAPGNPALSARIDSTLHCVGMGETGHWVVGATVHVYPHTPLKEVTAAPATDPTKTGALVSIKGGSGVTITVVSTDKAPQSNAHVSVQWSGAGVPLVISPASTLYIPWTLFSVSQVFATKKTNAPKKVTISANSGVGGPVQVTFQIVP
jgi:hypothetical protein